MQKLFFYQFIYKSCIYLLFYPIIDISIAFLKYDIFKKYCSYNEHRKLYILSNIIKSIFLFQITISYLSIILFNNFEIDWNKNSNNIKSLVISYLIPDFWSIIITSNTIKLSTIFHHICVIIATIFIMFSDLNKSGVHISFIMYGLYSAYTFLVNFFLGARFITNFNNKFLLTTNLSYIVSCSINWNWQIYYTYEHFYFHYQWFIFLTLVYFWIYDDLKLINFLLNNKNM